MNTLLDGVVVLDLTRFFSGPQCTLLLAGMGAEVIKIDDPRSGDPTAFAPPFAGPSGVSFDRMTDTDMGLAYLKRQRGKKSITLDLKSPAGRDIFMELVRTADVVVDNFSSGVTTRLGIDYAVLSQVNPAIVCCSLTGYGQTGPDHDAKAYDLMVQAAVGLVGLSGTPGGPPAKAATAMSDAIAGVFAATGIVSALFHRQKTGAGQAIDVSMADCLFSLIFDEPIDCYQRLGVQTRQGNRIMRFSPFNVYRAIDGWVAIGTATHAEWLTLLDTMGQGDLPRERPEFLQASWRIANNDEVDAVVNAWLRDLTCAQVIESLGRAGVPCSLVRSIDDVLAWEQLRARKMIVALTNPLSGGTVDAGAPGFPLKFSRTPASYDAPAPVPGAHTDSILAQRAGLTEAQIRQLRADGVI